MGSGNEVVQEFTRGQRILAGFVLCVCFLVVGGSAFWVSYEHIRFVALLKHQPAHLAWVYPLTVDGMLGIGAVSLWQDSVRGMEGRLWAKVVFWLGLGVSIAANVIWYVAVWGWDPVGVGVAAWPAAALLFSVEVVTNPSRRRKVLKATAKAAAEAERLIRTVAKPVTPHTAAPGAVATAEQATAVQATAASNGSGQAGQSTTVRENVPAQPAASSRRREENEQLDDKLVDLALQVGREWRKRTGREITRDGLRVGLRDAGWHRGISNVTAGRLLDLLRRDADGHTTDGDQDPKRVEVAAANGR